MSGRVVESGMPGVEERDGGPNLSKRSGVDALTLSYPSSIDCEL